MESTSYPLLDVSAFVGSPPPYNLGTINSRNFARFTPTSADPVPVPVAGVLMMGGLAASGALARRRRKGMAA